MRSDGNLILVQDFKFSKYTTYGCGGGAALALFPTDLPQLKISYNLAKTMKSCFILGNGSNVLASDNFYDGAVICTKNFSGIYQVDDTTLCCLSGTKISSLLKFCQEHSLGGLEYLSGIPASVGGLVYMNGGACGKYICENVVKVYVYDGETRCFSVGECEFLYKSSVFQDKKCVISRVYLRVYPQNPEIIRANMLNHLNKRSHLPKGKSCGCVFKNPQNYSAGAIIDALNLKGLKLNGAYVSDIHGNFILNYGSSAADIKNLIDYIKTAVFFKSGIKLKEEVIYIGEF